MHAFCFHNFDGSETEKIQLSDMNFFIPYDNYGPLLEDLTLDLQFNFPHDSA